MSPAEVGPCTPEEFWGDYEAHTGLTPPTRYAGSSKVAATFHPDTTAVWRDRGVIIATQQARIAQLEANAATVLTHHLRRGLPEHHRTDESLAFAPDRCSQCWDPKVGGFMVWPCPTVKALS